MWADLDPRRPGRVVRLRQGSLPEAPELMRPTMTKDLKESNPMDANFRLRELLDELYASVRGAAAPGGITNESPPSHRKLVLQFGAAEGRGEGL
jgi:hypothetical protein